MNKVVSYIGVVLALLTIFWQAATQWQELKGRVTALEREQMYLHGTIVVPKEIK